VTKISRLHFLVLAGMALFLIVVCGCTNVPPHPVPVAQQTLSGANSTVERVEVYHFHRTQQCTSCTAIGNLTEKTLKANFKKELASGRLVFAHVGYELPENAALAAKYGVTGSSLWIGVYDANGFHKEEDTRVWSLINNKDAFSTYLSGVITKRLNGDLS
jgi:hypothetical protein